MNELISKGLTIEQLEQVMKSSKIKLTQQQLRAAQELGYTEAELEFEKKQDSHCDFSVPITVQTNQK